MCIYIYVNMCICYRSMGKMHLDEFGVNTIGNQSKPVCPEIGSFLQVIQRVVSTTFQCSGGSHRKHQQEMWLPWMWHQTTCFLQTSITTTGSILNHSKLLKQHVYYRQNLDLKLEGGICTFVVFVCFCWI